MRLSLIYFFIFLFVGSVSGQKSYYVSSQGANSNNGLTRNQAFKTIEYGISALSAGDTLTILNGTYSHTTYNDGNWFKSQKECTIYINGINGTSNKWITIRGESNKNTTLNGDGLAIALIKNASYIKLQNLHFEGDTKKTPLDTALKYQFLYKDNNGVDQYRMPPFSSDSAVRVAKLSKLSYCDRPTYFNSSGIAVLNSHHIQIIGNTVNHITGEGIKSFDSDYLTIKGNEVFDCAHRTSGGVHGISLYTQDSYDNSDTIHSVIEQNLVYNNYCELYSWVHTKTFITPEIDEGKGITVQRCTPAEGWFAGKIRIQNNISFNNGFSGVHINDGNRIEIIHNTVYNNHQTTKVHGNGSQHGISIQGGDTVICANNIVFSDTSVVHGDVVKLGQDSKNCIIKNNVIYGEINSFTSYSSYNNIFSDPVFNDPKSNKFDLLKNSQALNAALDSFNINFDFLSNKRDNKPDIGALEYVNCNSSKSLFLSVCDTFISPSGKIITKSGNYIDTINNYSGCDSIISIALTINHHFDSVITVKSCDTFVSSAGIKYFKSGNYFERYTNIHGCDSTLNYKLTISPILYSSENIEACDTFWSNGMPITNSQTLQFIFKTIHGCDSVVDKHITIKKSVINFDTIIACKYILFRGVTYNQNQIVEWHGITHNGCDSTVITHIIIIKPDNKIELVNDTFFAAKNSDTYQWLNCNNWEIQTDGNNQWFIPLINGNYAVEVSTKNCKDTSECITINTLNLSKTSFFKPYICASPETDNYLIFLNNPNHKEFNINIYNLNSKQILNLTSNQNSISLPRLNPGIYYIECVDNLNKKTTLKWLCE